jgi:FKBP-type peptidyl-prolyl cis-trans isomerase
VVTANASGTQPKRNDAVLINYTGWKQATGETFFSNKGRGQPFRLNLAQAAPGFTEALQMMHKGETAMLWMPAAIGYKTPPPKPEPLVYQLELVDVISAPPVPDDVARPPAAATQLPLDMKRVGVKPGTGKDKARQFDNVTFNYTVWDASGKMLDTTTTRERATTAPPYKESPALGEMLTSMTEGERARFWVAAERTAVNGRQVPGAQGIVCYEVEVQKIAKAEHEPPPTPPDVAKPPANAKKSAKGVFYRVLKATTDKGAQHPAPSDTVKVHYTGWTTDGRMFDSSVLRGDKSTFNLKAVVAGWTEGLPLMAVGDTFRFWIPEELAYKGQPGKPKGMLVFDIELFEIVAPTSH